MEEDTELEHMENFKRIASDLKVYEDEYGDCIRNIEEIEFTNSTIEACVGKNLIKIIVDIKYETMKIISRADTKMREFFIDFCYIDAGEDEEFSASCDIMERDALDLLWYGLNFIELLRLN